MVAAVGMAFIAFRAVSAAPVPAAIAAAPMADPIFAPPALDRLQACAFTKLAVTDTIPVGTRADVLKDRLEVLGVAELIGEAIHRIHHNQSVSALFDKNGERRYEIVGLVGDSVYTSPRDGMMATMYVPLAQLEPRTFSETVILTINAARGQRATVEREVAAALARTEPTIAFTFRTFDQFIDATVSQERLVAIQPDGRFGADVQEAPGLAADGDRCDQKSVDALQER